MTPNRARAVTLLDVLVVVLCVGILANMAGFVLSRALIVKRATLSWANDDAVVDSLMRALRHDVSNASAARIDEAGGLVLLDGRTGAKVRYARAGDITTRSDDDAGPKAGRKTWTLRRTVLRWTIERTDTGAALIWVSVEIRETPRQDRHHAPRVLNRYAMALRFGSDVFRENRR